jgi:hypothetical protein
MQLEKTLGPFLHNIISSLRLRYHKYHFTALLMWPFKVSIFFKSISTSLFTGGTFYSNLDIFHEYLMQQSLKLGSVLILKINILHLTLIDNCPLYLNERRTLLSNCDDININIETLLFGNDKYSYDVNSKIFGKVRSEKVKKSEKLLTLALKSFWLIYKSSNFSKYFGVDVITILIVPKEQSFNIDIDIVAITQKCSSFVQV